MIFHITTARAWDEARARGLYAADTLETEGFIHCSTAAQVLAVADAFYAGQRGLVLLQIDEPRLQSEVRYENLEGGTERFPHIHGPLNLDAVVAAHRFEPGEGGRFAMPPEMI